MTVFEFEFEFEFKGFKVDDRSSVYDATHSPCWHQAATLSNCINIVMADTVETAAGMSNLLKFMKFIGQLKVRIVFFNWECNMLM